LVSGSAGYVVTVSSQSTLHAMDEAMARTDRRLAVAGGLVAAGIGFGGMAVVGSASTLEARRLLDAVLPSARFAASAYIAGGAAILALMLTMITFSLSHDIEFRDSYYRRVRDVSALTTAVIAGSVLLLVFLSLPLGEADVNLQWHVWAYYAILLGNSLVGGTFIAVILMIASAVRGLVDLGLDPARSDLVAGDGSG